MIKKPNLTKGDLLCFTEKCYIFYLEDVEGFKLDVGTLVSEQVHHQLEVLSLADVARHHCEVVPVQ